MQVSRGLQSGASASVAGLQHDGFDMPVVVRSFEEGPLYLHAPVKFWPAKSHRSCIVDGTGMVADDTSAPAIDLLPTARPDTGDRPRCMVLRRLLPPEEPDLALHTSLDIGPQRSEDSTHSCILYI